MPLAGCGGPSAASGTGAARPAAPPASGSPVATVPTAAPASSAAVQTTEPVKVRVGVSDLVGEAAIYIAMDKGYFQEQGLDVELISFTQNTDKIPALTTGEIDFAAASIAPGFYNAAERAIPLKVVSYLSVINPRSVTAGLMVRQDHVDSGRYREPRDFKGMLVAIASPPGGSTDYFLEKFAERAGITLQDMDTTVLPFPQMAAALANKAADAAYNVEPFVSVAEQQGIAKFVVPNGQFLPGVPVFVLQISPVFARAQPQAADRFMVAVLKGQRFNHEAVNSGQGTEEVYTILQNHTPIKDTRLMGRMLSDLVLPDGTIDPTPLIEIQDAFVRYGTVQQKQDVSQLIDASYAARALQQLGR